ncbi:MAG: phosphoenolpyruvate-utilizing N-terminal domain-containing protein, partial [Pygmaiobacter sp.]
MTEIKGKGVCEGIAFGPLYFLKRAHQNTERRSVTDTAAELERFHQGKSVAIQQLGMLYRKALAEVGKENSLLFEIHQMMLEDLDYCESIEGIITGESVCAE